MSEAILMGHVLFGMLCIIMAVFVFVDLLNASEANLKRIRCVSTIAAACMWVSFVIGGYWYVRYYSADKSVILKGPWPFAHEYFMETKEHLVIILLLLATYLPIVVGTNPTKGSGSWRLALWVSGAIALLGLMIEGHGAMIAMGVKMGLLARHG